MAWVDEGPLTDLKALFGANLDSYASSFDGKRVPIQTVSSNKPGEVVLWNATASEPGRAQPIGAYSRGEHLLASFFTSPRTPVGSSGANGPFISVAGPVLDANGKPVGFEFAMSNVAIGSPISRELYVICADVSQ